MSKTYRPYNPDQQFLLAPSLRDWLPEGHLVYFVSDTIDEMDLSSIEGVYEKSRVGYPPYHPRMMVKLLFYAYCTGTFSSRKIASKLEDDVAFRILAAGNKPDFRTISDFRKLHLDALKTLFVEVLMLCSRAGMVRLGHVSLDGTKQKANASKHKAMSYVRMKEESARLSEEISQLLSRAGKVDETEDGELGLNVRGDELPKELAFRQGRLGRIRQAMAELEAEAKQACENEQVGNAGCGDEAKADGDGAKPAGVGRAKKKPADVPADKAQKNFTDGESKIMLSGNKSFIQGYNAQAAVDSDYQVVVASALTNQAADSVHVELMVEEIEQINGQVPDEMSLDAGYYSDANVKYLEAKNIDVYMPPMRLKHREYRQAKPDPIDENTPTRERMKSKVLTDVGREKYGLRKQTVEPVFGQIKRCLGFRQFSMRGIKACEAEWNLVCAAHNLLKLFRYGAVAMAAMAQESMKAAQSANALAFAA